MPFPSRSLITTFLFFETSAQLDMLGHYLRRQIDLAQKLGVVPAGLSFMFNGIVARSD